MRGMLRVRIGQVERERRHGKRVKHRQHRRAGARVDGGIGGQRGHLVLAGIAQPVARREQPARRLGTAAARVGTGDARPRHRERSAEMVGTRAGAARKQHVRHAPAFRPGQPGSHERVGEIEQVVDVERAPRHEHGNDGLVALGHRLQYGQVLRVAVAVPQRRRRHDVAHGLRVRRLADHRHDGVEGREIHPLCRFAVGDVGRASGLAQPGQDRFAVGEVGIAVARALPGQRPAAGLVRQAVGALPHDQDLHPRLQGQRAAVVLQQDQRFAHGAPRQLAALQRPGVAGAGPLRRPRAEQAHAQLGANDPADGIIDARHRDVAVLDLAGGVRDEGLPVVGHHHHVDAGIDRLRATGIGASRQLADGIPVGNDEALEAHLVLQRTRQQGACARHLPVVDAGGHVIPAVVGRHHALHAGLDRAEVARAVHVDHVLQADPGVALVRAVVGRPVADEMLGGRHHVVVAEVALQPAHVGARIRAHQRTVAGKTFVGASPAGVLRHGERRREHPFDAGGAHRPGGRRADRFDQGRVVRRTQADVVREHRGPEDVVVPVHGVDAPDDRHLDRRVGRHRRIVVAVGQRQPVPDPGVLVSAGPGAAAIEYRADVVFRHLGRRDRLDLGLRHLADLLGEAHARHDFSHARFQRRIGWQSALDRRPVRIVRRLRQAMAEGWRRRRSGVLRRCRVGRQRGATAIDRGQYGAHQPQPSGTNHGEPRLSGAFA